MEVLNDKEITKELKMMIKMKILLAVLVATLMLFSACESNQTGAYVSLTTDHLVNPLGIENPDPSFSWIIEA